MRIDWSSVHWADAWLSKDLCLCLCGLVICVALQPDEKDDAAEALPSMPQTLHLEL